MKLALTATFDLMLLDLVLPQASGFDILKALRRERPGTPVIILSARGEENDRVRGLRLGADDYVVKPFSVRELLARVEAVLRRAPERQPVSETLTLAAATIDFGQSEARFENGERAELSERERDVLRYLALNRGRPVSREELLQRVWHIDNKQTETRTVDMHIANLRHKLRDDAESPLVIITVRGKGYQLA
jgi:DNA-binding response OmpR family regulator